MDSIHIQTSKASSIAGSVAARLKGIASGKILFCFLIYLILLTGQKSFGQGVGISEVSITPDPSAILEVRSILRGFLVPRMTQAQRDAIVTTASSKSLLIFNTTTNEFNYYDGVSTWIPILSGNYGVTSISGTTNQITIGGTSTVPNIGIALNYAGQTSITSLGAIGTGTWQAGVITGQYGGTGIANTGKIITLGGNISTGGDFNTSAGNNLTFTTSAATNLTLPATGTVATLNGNEALTNKTINGLTPTSQAVGFTLAGGTSSKTLTLADNATISGTISGTNTGDITITGQNYLSLAGQTLTANSIDFTSNV